MMSMLPCMVVVVCMFGVICRSEEPTSFIGLLGKTLAKYDTLKNTYSRRGILFCPPDTMSQTYHLVVLTTHLPFGCVDNKHTIWLCLQQTYHLVVLTTNLPFRYHLVVLTTNLPFGCLDN